MSSENKDHFTPEDRTKDNRERIKRILVMQWLGHCTSAAEGKGQSLAGNQDIMLMEQPKKKKTCKVKN